MGVRIGINALFLVPGDVGGAEVYFLNTVRSLLRSNGDTEFVIFTTRDNDAYLQKELSEFQGVKFIRLNFNASCRPLRIIAEQTLLPFMVGKKKVDLLWSPGYTAPGICRCPQVVTIFDLQYKSHPEDLSFMERITLDTLVRISCRICKAVITISDFSKSEVVRWNMTSEDRVWPVHLGVDPDFAVNTSGGKIINDICPSLPAGRPFILCVAHSYPHKKLHVLIDAFSKIHQDITHHLVLIGKPRRGEEDVQKSLEMMSHPEKVHRLHGVSFDGLKALYQAADIFVLPSVYEGFGLPVLEAMMAGVPVITSRMASLPEVGGDHAVYVETETAEGFARSILDVSGWEEGKKEQWIVAARKWAETFTWEKSADKTMKVFQQVLKADAN